MKIGIVVHSKTGHSLKVANQLKQSMVGSGNQVDILEVEAVNDGEPKVGSVRLRSIPDVSSYPLIIFGGPVRGGRLSPVLQSYLAQLPSLQGKMIMGYVTQAFPFPSMGGNQAIGNLTEILKEKNTELINSAIVNWMFKGTRNKQISDLIDSFGKVGV